MENRCGSIAAVATADAGANLSHAIKADDVYCDDPPIIPIKRSSENVASKVFEYEPTIVET
ncbi:major facilitator superfamily MFS_1 transporter [Rhodovulum sulfidophilum]|uniref:Major facilitator superfamily MFS_1 transporter n=1 Tax=Rhodovulum sulfidophilum TaxID=35806 RepID=A0A0D6B4T5_RHOSU|nr:major facilitator superfamily MFS_1 transporter [Rhodovulum sulfidophilum]